MDPYHFKASGLEFDECLKTINNHLATLAGTEEDTEYSVHNRNSTPPHPDHNSNMNNPADLVPPSLLPHVHLVSTYNYPLAQNIPVEAVVEYLLQAPRIARDLAPVGWKFLDPPRDGTIMLVWQPPQLETHFASDGLIWADAEYAFDTDARGYKLVMYKHKAGYIPHQETHIAHSRRRYRLTGVATTNPNPLPIDPSLWLVHYCAADPADRIPTSGIPISRQASISLSQRASFQQHGQLSRNEFMLNDRIRWPTVNLPPNVNLAPSVNVPSGNVPHPAQQTMAYPSNIMPHAGQTQEQSFAQPAQVHVRQGDNDVPLTLRERARKARARLEAREMGKAEAARPAASAPPAPTVADEEEGDPLDFITPRDVASDRYKQHQEYMEELFNSPYPTPGIMPGEIGLGRKGEIEAITKEFFKAHISAEPPTGSAGPSKLTSEKMVIIRKAFAAYMAEQDAEIEEMKKEHARNMARMDKCRRLGELEREMRTAPLYADNRDAAYCIFDCSTGLCGHNFSSTDPPRRTVDEIAKEAEELLGMKLEDECDEVIILEKGGLDENWAAAHGFHFSGNSSTQRDTQPGQSTTFTVQPDVSTAARVSPVDQQTPPSTYASESHPIASEPLASTEPAVGEDIAMEGAANELETKRSESSEWVMLGPEDTVATSANQDEQSLENFADLPPKDEPQGPENPLNTATVPLDGFMPDITENVSEGFVGNDFNSTMDFGNLDSAGEALAGYDELGLDDSAFGAAYQGPEANPGEQHEMDES